MLDELCRIHGEDFTGEPVRVVEEKKIRLYGTASTGRDVLRMK